MSLINQMLKDLDARKDGEASISRLPNEVRALPKSKPSRMPTIAAAILLLVVAGGYGLYEWQAMREQPAPVAQANTPSSSNAVLASGAEMSIAAPEPVKLVQEKLQVAEAPKVGESPSPLPPQSLNLQMAETMAPENPVERVVPTEKSIPQVRSEMRAPDGQRRQEDRSGSARLGLPDPVASKAAPAKENKTESQPESKASMRIEKTVPVATPKDIAEAEYRKSVLTFNQGRAEEAIEHLQRALRQNSLHVASRQLLLHLLLEAGRVDEAIRTFREGLDEQPAQIGWAMGLARLQVERDDLGGAWKTLEFSLPAAGRNADYPGFAGHVLHRLGRFREAAERYQSAIGIAPSDGRWWLGLGLALEADGQLAPAREAFLRARQTGTLEKPLAAMVEQKLR